VLRLKVVSIPGTRHSGGRPDRHVFKMGLEPAGGRFPASARIEAPRYEPENLCIVENVLDQTGAVATTVPRGIAQLRAYLSA